MKRLTGIWALVLVVTGGCAARYGTIPISHEGMSAAEDNFQNVWLATRYVLEKYYFTIDREDRRAGLISTRPLTSQQIFEFWRRDGTTPEKRWESTVHTMYRIVTVRIERGGPNSSEFDPHVRVTVGRSDQAEPIVQTLSDAYELSFTEADAEARKYEEEDRTAVNEAVEEAAKRDKPVEPVAPSWFTPLGEDEMLAGKIEVAIKAAAARREYIQGLVAN